MVLGVVVGLAAAQVPPPRVSAAAHKTLIPNAVNGRIGWKIIKNQHVKQFFVSATIDIKNSFE